MYSSALSAPSAVFMYFDRFLLKIGSFLVKKRCFQAFFLKIRGLAKCCFPGILVSPILPINAPLNRAFAIFLLSTPLNRPFNHPLL
jgi:hypothetical protein